MTRMRADHQDNFESTHYQKSTICYHVIPEPEALRRKTTLPPITMIPKSARACLSQIATRYLPFRIINDLYVGGMKLSAELRYKLAPYTFVILTVLMRS